MDLMQVRKGEHLHWPTSITTQMDRYRGGAGYCVDMGLDLERAWCAGQMHKLERAPDGAKPSSIENGNAKRLRGQVEVAEVAEVADVKLKVKADAAGIMDPVKPKPKLKPAAMFAADGDPGDEA